jgi:threonine/homoserine/homoserine lactone efflux protein
LRIGTILTHVDAFLLAVLAGLAVSVPPGPLGALCVTQTLRAGLRAGIVVALAVAAGDALLGSVAALGADAVSQMPVWVRRSLAAIVALALFWIGMRVLRRAGEPPKPEPERKGWRSGAGAFLLALATPGTLPALLVLFATFQVRDPVVAYAGVFAGGFAWWLTLCLVSHRLRDRAQSVLVKVDYACGALLWLGSGVAARAVFL